MSLVKVTLDAATARDLAERIMQAVNAGAETFGKGTTITLRQDGQPDQYVQLNVLKDFSTVRTPPGFEERAKDFWSPTPTTFDKALEADKTE